MIIKVNLYGFQLNGNRNSNFSVNIQRQSKVKDLLSYLNLQQREDIIIMVNHKHCDLNFTLKNEDSISIFPMIAGG